MPWQLEIRDSPSWPHLLPGVPRSTNLQTPTGKQCGRCMAPWSPGIQATGTGPLWGVPGSFQGGWCQEGRGNKTWSPTSAYTHGWAPRSHSTMSVPRSGLVLAHCPFPESEEQPQRVAHVSHQSPRCLMPVFSRSEAARTSQEPSPQWCKARWRNEWQLPGGMASSQQLEILTHAMGPPPSLF